MPVIKRTNIPNEEAYRIIELTSGFVTKVSLIDYRWLSCQKWFAKHSFSKIYAARIVRVSGKKRLRLMHRFIMRPDPSFVVHHINGDSLDNRRSNLQVMPEFDHIKLHSWR